MPEDTELIGQVKTLGAQMSRRARCQTKLEKYDGEGYVYPEAVRVAGVTKAYRMLMPMSDAPWGSLIVDSIMDRLEPSGISDTDKDAATEAWGIWQDNSMDAEWRLLQRSALRDGRAFALTWPEDGKNPEITLDDCSQMIVQYAAGSRRRRVAALRRWVDGDMTYATLYRPDGIYKFQGEKQRSADATDWKRRTVPGEDWPVDNPEGVVPVVEVAVNRRLKPGTFGYARGEYEHCLGLIDRIHLLTFLGLVVAFYMGFPLRGVIGEKITREVLKDDNGDPILLPDGTPRSVARPPFDAHAGGIFQLENPNAQIAAYQAADRKNLSVFAELDQLAVVTKTPRHYFPLEQGMSNLSADAIRASEGGLHAKAKGHKSSLGEAAEELLRVACAQKGKTLSQRAELGWMDHESRSLAERADAASKLKDVLPWQAVAEIALNATNDQINQWQSQRTTDAFGTLLAAATQPTAPAPAPEPVA